MPTRALVNSPVVVRALYPNESIGFFMVCDNERDAKKARGTSTDRDVYGYDVIGFDALHQFVDDTPRPTSRAAMREMRRSRGRALA